MKGKIDSEKIILRRIQMLQGGIRATKEFRKLNEKVESFDFSFKREFLFNPNEKLIVVELKIDLKALKSGKTKLVPAGLSANYEYQFYFLIDNIGDFINDENVHPSIVSTVLSIAYSTLRGIILERTSGTLLGSVILPIVNPAKLLSEGLSGNAERGQNTE